MKIALVNNNVVTAIVEIEQEQYNEYARANDIAIDITEQFPEPEVGWTFDGTKLNDPDGPYRRITKLAFRQRFTIAELAGVVTATKTNPVLEVLLDNVRVSTYVDLSRQDTQDGVMYLVSQGLITLERANIILNTEPSSIEIYRGE